MGLAFVTAAICFFLLGSLFWRRTALIFFTLMPLYYAPFLFINNLHSEEWFYLRAGKDLFLLSIIAAWFVGIVLRGKIRRVNDPTVIPILIFIAIGLVLLSRHGVDYWLDIARIFLLGPICFFVARDLFRTRTEVWQQLYRWIIVSAIVSFIGVVEWLTGGSENVFSRAAGQHRVISTLFSPNSLGWYLAAMNALLLGWTMIPRDRQLVKLATVYVIVIWFANSATILLTGSRSALLANAIILMIWVVFTKNRVVALTVTISILAGAFMAYIQVLSGEMSSIRALQGFETSRWEIYGYVLFALMDAGFWVGMFGAQTDQISMLNSLGFSDDSFWLNVGLVGGLLSLMVGGLCLLVALVSSKNVRWHSRQWPRAPFIFSVVMLFGLGVIGNVQGIFPLSIFYWVFLALIMPSSVEAYQDVGNKSVP